MVRQRYQSIPSRDIGNQRILESEWHNVTSDHTQPRAVPVNVTFPWWLSPCKTWRYYLGFSNFIADHRIIQSRQNMSHPTKKW